jgi:hypothetical protein
MYSILVGEDQEDDLFKNLSMLISCNQLQRMSTKKIMTPIETCMLYS